MSSELSGPENVQPLLAPWRVFAVTAITWELVSQAALEPSIETLTRLWSSAWHLIAVANDKCRAEHIDRLRLASVSLHQRTGLPHATSNQRTRGRLVYGRMPQTPNGGTHMRTPQGEANWRVPKRQRQRQNQKKRRVAASEELKDLGWRKSARQHEGFRDRDKRGTGKNKARNSGSRPVDHEGKHICNSWNNKQCQCADVALGRPCLQGAHTRTR